MKKDNSNEKYASIEIQIWADADSNGMFLYKNGYENKFKKVYFNFDEKRKYCFLIKTKNNCIKRIYEQKDVNGNYDILFEIRASLKNNNIYETINPICRLKKNISNYNNDFLNNKIWFSVKSQTYNKGNIQNYNLNENDIIKLGKKKYIINKFHFASEEKIENIKDENFYKNNNISYISLINKKSKSVFKIFELKANQYKINENKKINTEKVNQEKGNEVNKKESQNLNNNTKGAPIDTNLNTINDNNISSNTSSKNKEKSMFSTIDNSKSFLNIDVNDNEDSENKYGECWICLDSFSDINNPLICLCNCHDYIHFKCLKEYLTSKIIVTENLKKTVITYTCNKFNCDICLKPYYLRFRIPEFDKTYELIDLNLPEEADYFCLESLNYIKDNNNNIKTVHIVQLNDEEINIGRNNSNDIIDNDLSVSREHAVLKYNKDNRTLFLENKNGKYGTLVLVRGNIKVSEEKTFFQILNTHISMELKAKIGKEKFTNRAL